MRQGFQKVLKTRPPRDFFTSSEAFIFGGGDPMTMEGFKRKLSTIPMRTHLVKYVTISVLVATLCGVLNGCYMTKPNRSIIDEHFVSSRQDDKDKYFLAAKAILAEISSKNRLLAIELGKLPEFQDGIALQELKGLDNLVKIYNENSSAFDIAFEEMFKIGIPEIRKYCSPLQALFWLSEDGKLDRKNNPLIQYSLKELLDEAWKPDELTTPLMTDEQILEVIEGIRDKYMRNLYLGYMQSGKKLLIQKCFKIVYSEFPGKLSRSARKIIKQTLIGRKDLGWGKFDVVVDRLNAPELVDYYERTRIDWVDWRTLPYHPVVPSYVFETNKGDCVSITHFTIRCLSKNGYKAREIRVPAISAEYRFHAICLFKVNGKRYIMDNGRPGPIGILPYEGYYFGFGR